MTARSFQKLVLGCKKSVDLGNKLVAVSTVNLASSFNALASGVGATEAVHTYFKKELRCINIEIKNVSDDGILSNFHFCISLYFSIIFQPLIFIRERNLFNVCAEAFEFTHNVVVAALNEMDLRNLSSTFSAKSRNYHGDAGSQVNGNNVCSVQGLSAFNNGSTSVNVNGCAHLFQLLGITESLFVNTFGNVADAV